MNERMNKCKSRLFLQYSTLFVSPSKADESASQSPITAAAHKANSSGPVARVYLYAGEEACDRNVEVRFGCVLS